MSDGRPIGDEEFRALYDTTAPRLAAYLRGLVRSAEAADELVQEAFMRLLTSAPAGLDDRRLVSWLYTTATRLARDGWRRRQVDRRWRWRKARDWAGSGGGDADAEAAEVRSGLDPDLERALARLAPRQRSLLWLAYVEELGHREIADALGLGTNSVRVLLFRARRRFAEVLDEMGLAPAAGSST